MYDDGTSCHESSGISEQEIENAISAGKLVVCSFITMHGGDILTTELMASSVLGPYPVFTGTCRTSSGLLAVKVTYDEENSTAQQEMWSVERTYIPSGNTLSEPVTYSQLLSKISNSQLVTGKSYRITDYVTTTAKANTSSAGHAFDLVVTAIDVNKLDCRASAVLHSEDTYFSTAGADLGKWQIWYDVVNDANKYEWADSTNGKGVIYRMIDEWGNECPYDFKNMLFTKVNVYSAAYTFNKFASGDASNMDHSLNGTYCHGNKIKAAISNLRTLNFIVFLNGSTTSYCENNTFENNCSNNTLGNNCSNNTFGKNCSNNTFEGNCIYNRIGGNCIGINVGAGGQFNTFGDSCQNIKFGNVCSYNKIGENCSAIVFGDTSGNSGDRIRDVIIENGNIYIRVFCENSGYAELRNIFIAQGCSGTSSAYTEISTIERNLAYRTTVGRDSSGNIRIYNEDDPASAPPITIDTELSETSTNPVQNKAINVLTRKLWDKVDIVPRLDNEYVRRNLYIVSSTNNKWGGTSTSNYKHWIVPVDNMREVIITANANTAQAYSFFKSYSTPVSGSTPDYATGYSGIKGVSAGETLKITVPNDAEYLYINTGNNGAGKAAHIYLTGVGITEHDGSGNGFVKDDGSIDYNEYLTLATCPQEVYICQYANDGMSNGVTVNDIMTAYNAGKLVYCELKYEHNSTILNAMLHLSNADNSQPVFVGIDKHSGDTTIYILKYDSGEEVWNLNTEIIGQSVLPSIEDNADKALFVNSSGNGVEWRDVSSGGASSVTSVIPSGTVSGTAATSKKVTISSVTALTDGTMIRVKNNDYRSTVNCTLNLNELGAKPIYIYRAGTWARMTNEWAASFTYLLVYNTRNSSSGRWDVIGRIPTDTEQGFGMFTCDTAAATVAKTATSSSTYKYNLNTNSFVCVKFTNAVPANATLSIDDTTAKSIRYRGAAITDNVIKAGDAATFVYDGTYYQLISIDRWGIKDWVLDDINDVSIDTPAEGQILEFDGNNWTNVDSKILVCNAKLHEGSVNSVQYVLDVSPKTIHDAVLAGKSVVVTPFTEHETHGEVVYSYRFGSMYKYNNTNTPPVDYMEFVSAAALDHSGAVLICDVRYEDWDDADRALWTLHSINDNNTGIPKHYINVENGTRDCPIYATGTQFKIRNYIVDNTNNSSEVTVGILFPQSGYAGLESNYYFGPSGTNQMVVAAGACAKFSVELYSALVNNSERLYYCVTRDDINKEIILIPSGN